jgi:hypothetical protein
MINQTLPAITLDEFVLSMRSAEALEGMRSFAEKRAPAWDQDLSTERSVLRAQPTCVQPRPRAYPPVLEPRDLISPITAALAAA